MASSDKELSLYNGKFTVTYKDNGHKYKVNGMPVKGVTTILSNVLAKNGLMLWPLNKAMEYLEQLVVEGETIDAQCLLTARNQHVIARDSGANTGTLIHSLAEKVLLGEQIDLLEHPEEVIKAIEGFEHWLAENSPEVLSVERVVYSANYDYIGTLDSILKINGKNYLCDLKTTNVSRDAPKGIYPENFIQLGGYAKAYLEELEYDGDNGIDDLMIISCKKDGKVDTVKASDLGMTVRNCIDLWDAVHDLHIGLDRLKNKLKGA